MTTEIDANDWGAMSRMDKILAKQPIWEELDGQSILRVASEPIAAVPTNGKRSSPKFVVFDLTTREELAQISKDEIDGWLRSRAVDRLDEAYWARVARAQARDAKHRAGEKRKKAVPDPKQPGLEFWQTSFKFPR